MKQIIIKTFRNSIEIGREEFFIEHLDMFIRDNIDNYIKTNMQLNKLYGNNNIIYEVEINNCNIMDNYDFYKLLASRIEHNKNNIENRKKYIKKMEMVMRKWYSSDI